MSIDTCADCARQRRRYERWFWQYPDILPPGPPVPIAKFCPPCGERRGLKRKSHTKNVVAALVRSGR